jgi:protein TonB
MAIGVVAAGTWFWRPWLMEHGVSAPAQPPPAAPTTSERNAVSEATERFEDLLHRGALAFEAGRLATPTGDNALDYYLTILSIEPGEPTARARLAAVVDALFAEAESALLANSLDDAATALAGVRRADAASSRLAFLEAQLQRAAAANAAAAAAPKHVARDATSPTASADAPAAPVPTELDSLLVIATARLARGQLLDPSGDSASEYLRRATDLNPGDSRVARARGALGAALLDAAHVALGKNGVDDAKRLLKAAKEFGVSAEAFAAADADIAGAEHAAADRRHAELLMLAEGRLRAGALTEPPGDNALEYLRNVQAEAPNSAGLGQAWDAWIAAQTARVRQAITTRSWAAGETALAALATAPRGAAAATPLREQLETERLQTQYLATASPAGELRLIDAPSVVYPPDARRLNIQGWVEMEFVVDRNGAPKDAVVVAAEPAGRFDQAALAAVAKYRYAPFEQGGHVYERRVKLRIRFALN